MATDRARRSYDAGRMYRSVVSQQGRVTLEADVNEAEDIRTAASRAQLVDIIGPSGSPDDGFVISIPASPHAPYDFAIGAGTLYVGGERIENGARAATFRGQRTTEWADYPAGAAAVDRTAPGTELVYLELTETEVTAVEDPPLREVALGGPDSAARTRLVQRVQRVPVTPTTCQSALDDAEQRYWAPGRALDRDTMRLVSAQRLKVGFTAPTAADDPCQPVAQAGFLGAENQLIRVQVASTGTGRAMLWGYDNSSFLYRATTDAAAPRKLTLAAAPVDSFHRPRPGQWVELLASAVVLDGDAAVAAPVGACAQVDDFDPGSLTLTLTSDVDDALLAATAPVFVRVWENLQPFAADATTATELLTVEGTGTGVMVYSDGAAAAVPGDHWLIGVRPSVPDQIFPARLRELQPPDGPIRWAVPLAVVSWTSDQAATVSDCRLKFHNLVSDDDDGDLAFHNKHLHGWGVVCGLQVHCMTTEYAAAHALQRPREYVIVRDGYAIHPTGVDIRLHAPAGDGITAVELADLAVAAGLARDANGEITDGAVSLWIDEHRVLRAERYDPSVQPTFLDRLDGTLLADIYNDCFLKVVEYVTAQLKPAAGDPPAGPAARRQIALINLFWQVIPNQASGQNIFLSGTAATDPAALIDTEHALLRDFFEGLKGLLQSKTFCAMFDDIAYPPYEIYADNLTTFARPATIFGTGLHTQLRLHPHRQLAYTFGTPGVGNNKSVNIYHRFHQKLLAVIDFPIAGAALQDLAFSLDRNEIYAIAWTGTGQVDSAFQVGRIVGDDMIVWDGPRVDCPGLKLCTLTLGDERPGVVYAAARGSGLYRFTADGAPPTLISAFNASGHLVTGRFHQTVLVYAGATPDTAVAASFKHVLAFDLGPGGLTRTFLLPVQGNDPGVGHDDLVVIPSIQKRDVDFPHAIIDGDSGRKRLVAWDPDDDRSVSDGAPPIHVVDLGASNASRIAYSAAGDYAMITYADTSLARVYRRERDTLESPLHPLQILPCAIATDMRGDAFYVLELLSNTLTAIPPTPDGSSVVDLTRLADYRRKAITAYVKMIGRVVQYLKDCICEHLLINCPDGTGKVYLADISFKDGKIYQICNFHRRKYVHTFPTLEYWLSIVPILPLLKQGVESLCCSVVAGLFDKLAPQDPKTNPDAKASDLLSPTMALHAATYVRAADLPGNFQLLKNQAFLSAGLAKTSLLDKLRTPSPGNSVAPSSAIDVAFKTPEEATRVAKARGIEVRNVEVASDDLRGSLALLTTPPAVRGETVDLVTDARGRVLGWKKAAPPPAPPPTPPPAAPPPPSPKIATPDELATLRRDLASVTAAHARQDAAVAEMRKQIAALTAQIAALQKH